MTNGNKAAGSARISVRILRAPPCYPGLTAGEVVARQALPAREKGRSAFHYASDTLNWGRKLQ
ncbi:MAG TPA: hypothetical protein VFO45_02650, partial [Sphingomicrobium sp.]|nr:hypothetical protein [Sphingomicrobium sp.]